MLLLRLWNYIRGYVIIICEGYNLGKFINICIHRGISLWGIKKQKNYSMIVKLRAKDFKLLRPVAQKARCKIRIMEKKGLPFFTNKLKKRKAFIAGFFVFICFIYIMTSYIWAIDVSGNNKVRSQVIIDNLASFGVKPGVVKFALDPDKIANEMMLKINDLSWIGIEIKGTKVFVKVKERVMPPEIVPKDSPCNIVASKDGVIKSIFTKLGQPKVNEGDTVIAGQMLISGKVISEDKEIKPRYAHAIGTVMARTWYEEVVPVNQNITEKVRTGKIKNRYSLILFSKKIGLLSGNIPYENHEDIEINKELTIGKNLILPFGYAISKSYEYKLIERKISLQEAKKQAADKAYKAILSDIPKTAKVVKSHLAFVSKENKLQARLVVECLENIGLAKKIGGK